MTQQTKPGTATIVSRPLQQLVPGAKTPLVQALPDKEAKFMKLSVHDLKVSIEKKKVRRAAVQDHLSRIDAKIAEREKRLNDLSKINM